MAKRILEPAERLDRARVMLEDAYTRARAEYLRDALTGSATTAVPGRARATVGGSARYHTRIALAIVDLDDFGKVNDTEGHVGGDRVSSA